MTEQEGPGTHGDSRTRRWLIRGLVAVAAVVVVGYGAIFIYAEVINDAPDELDTDDLSNALDEPTDASTASTIPAEQLEPPTTAPDAPARRPGSTATGSRRRHRSSGTVWTKCWRA